MALAGVSLKNYRVNRLTCVSPRRTALVRLGALARPQSSEKQRGTV
jgi:hypothetical protein